MRRSFHRRAQIIPLVLLLAVPTLALPRFELADDAWGLHFRHHHAGSGEFYMVETMGSGVVVFDYDQDGDADVFFVDSGVLPGYTGEPPVSRLFRNDGVGEDGARFVDVTQRSGIQVKAYGMGAVSGDVDGDGDFDLYLSSFGANQLFANNGDGTFTDVTASADVGDALLSTSAGFADPDGDGDLDLYVANYVDFDLGNNIVCGEEKYGFRSYCHPDVYNGVSDRYYRNRGDGTFDDATVAAGFGDARGKGLGVVWSDLSGDGAVDLYVANDMTFNFQYENRQYENKQYENMQSENKTGENKAGTFEDVAILMGTAASDLGEEEASMGIGIGDLDGNGRPDLYLTHIDFQTNALYSNVERDLFVDQRFISGLAEPSLKTVGFGTVFGDFDQDGDLDVVVANGHIIPGVEKKGLGTSYKQRNQLFANSGGGRFREVEDSGLDVVRVSRGLAHGDFDLDGDLDLVINNSNDVAEVYRNITAATGAWLKLDVRDTGGNTHGVGGRVEVTATGTQIREIRTSSSYLSQSDLTLHFGLGEALQVSEITIRRMGRPDVRYQGLAVKGLPVRGLSVNRRLRIALK